MNAKISERLYSLYAWLNMWATS